MRKAASILLAALLLLALCACKSNTPAPAAAVSAFTNYTIYCVQDGFGLEESGSDAYSEEQSNVLEDVVPGESIECAGVFLLRTDDPFAVVFKDFFTEEYFGKTFELSFG